MSEVFRTGDLTRECSLGHTWESCRKSYLSKCPYCGNRTLLTGFNDLLSRRPDLAEEYSSANSIPADKIVASCAIDVLWECRLGHYQWRAQLSERIRGKANCSVCLRRKIIPGINDLFTTHPTLRAEWSPINTVDAKKVHFGSSERVWWICSKCNNPYDSLIYNRTKGKECPRLRCQNDKANTSKRETYVIKSSSFSESRPDLLEEWDFVRNTSLDPTKISSGVKELAWWNCKNCSHKWRSTVDNRNRGRGCPKCSNRFSRLEEKAFNSIVEILKSLKNDTEIIQNSRPLREDDLLRELDIYIPDLKLAFEVQDFATHSRDSNTESASFKGIPITKKGPTYHKRKIELAKSQLDVDLYEIWEDEIRDGSFVSKVSEIISSRVAELALV